VVQIFPAAEIGADRVAGEELTCTVLNVMVTEQLSQLVVSSSENAST
jgi:hypothetical protein